MIEVKAPRYHINLQRVLLVFALQVVSLDSYSISVYKWEVDCVTILLFASLSAFYFV